MAPEKRLIDANNIQYHKTTECHGHGLFFTEQIAYKEEIERIPAVDAVEVVRCKDCEHGIWDEEEQMWECVLEVNLTGDLDTYSMFHEYNDGEHFCSYGERKVRE